MHNIKYVRLTLKVTVILQIRIGSAWVIIILRWIWLSFLYFIWTFFVIIFWLFEFTCLNNNLRRELEFTYLIVIKLRLLVTSLRLWFLDHCLIRRYLDGREFNFFLVSYLWINIVFLNFLCHLDWTFCLRRLNNAILVVLFSFIRHLRITYFDVYFCGVDLINFNIGCNILHCYFLLFRGKLSSFSLLYVHRITDFLRAIFLLYSFVQILFDWFFFLLYVCWSRLYEISTIAFSMIWLKLRFRHRTILGFRLHLYHLLDSNWIEYFLSYYYNY